ncbi:MAG: hypothetical protein IPJ88_01605 [Myxococcales bacterium]|nr:MAG: hypothetical protein IPJ88_01605 [Myxococcales bacterium]
MAGVEQDDEAFEAKNSGSFTVLQANVGNHALFTCSANNKLCFLDWERPIAERIRELDPDIVVLQEVFPAYECGFFNPNFPRDANVCSSAANCMLSDNNCEGSNPNDDSDDQGWVFDQSRRLLGPNYTIVCDPKYGYECVGLKINRAALAEPRMKPVPEGSYYGVNASAAIFWKDFHPNAEGAELFGLDDPGIPERMGMPQGLGANNNSEKYNTAFVPDCIYETDYEMSICAMNIQVNGKFVRLYNAHPMSYVTDPVISARASVLREMFVDIAKSLYYGMDNILLVGDMNLDPFEERSREHSDVLLWQSCISDFSQCMGKYASHDPNSPLLQWRYHNAFDQSTQRPEFTSKQLGTLSLYPVTYDYVISNYAHGTCTTLDSDKLDAADTKLDSGLSMDHSALFCELY